MRNTEHRDDEALRLLGRTHGRAVQSLVAHYERDPGEAEEIVSDVFLLAHQNMGGLVSAPDAQVRSWLLRTARFLTANEVRRSMTRRRLLDRLAHEPLPLVSSPDDEFAATEQTAAAQAQSERVSAILATLRDDYRETLVMDALGEHGDGIGAALGISANAARKRLMRARAAFRSSYINSLSDQANPRGGQQDE